MQKPSVPFNILLKAVVVVSSPPLAIMALLVIGGYLNLAYFLYAYGAILVLFAIFMHPFLANIATLTHYVNSLVQDKKVETPDLSFISTFSELSEALSRLHHTWERKKQQMEHIITEREILVDTLPDILIMLNDDKVIVRTNRAARAIFGQNLANRPLNQVITSERLNAAVTEVIEDLRGREVEFNVTEPSPHDFHAIIERFPIPSAGGISIIIALNDITELKRMEQMRADFVANASHEIRTPLASIMGFIETLQGPAKDDASARSEFLKIMQEQAQRMSKLIADLLSLSKIEMNVHTLPVDKVDMVRIVKNERQHFEWAARQKNITIRLDVHDNVPMVRGDEAELAQVVHNLVGNAIKYGSSNSEVTVTLKMTHSMPPDPHFRNLDKCILFSVRDRGEGISREHLPRLAERFYRVDTARARKVGGTGLGLAIVKHILNRHRGALVIDSVVGEGSLFSIYLHIYNENA